MVKQFLTAALIVGAVVTASAQQEKPTATQPSTQEGKQPSSQFNARDYTQIQSSEVPSSLKTTLGGSTYKGWETGKLYRNNNGDGYYLSTGTGSNVKNYYFDKDGKAIQRNNATPGMQKTTKDGTSVSPGSSQDSTSTGSQQKPQ